MSKVPVGSSPEVQQSFREVWEALDPYLRTNIDLSGRRIINAGPARAGSDYVTQQQVAGSSEFEAFYKKLKERGLDGFPGRLLEPQDAVAAAYPDPPPTTHAIGQVYYDPVSAQLKIVTAAGIIVLTSGSPLTAESGSGNVVRLDGTETFTGNRNINAEWTFQNNLILSAALPQISMVDTDSGEDDFYIKVNADTWWVAGGAGPVSIFGCTASEFKVWQPATFTNGIDVTGGELRISKVSNVWIRTEASSDNAGLLCVLPSQSWIAFGTTTHFNIKDETAGLYALTVAKATGATTIGTLTTGEPLKITSDAASAFNKIQTSATDGQVGWSFANDAREWLIYENTFDTFVIRDNTAGQSRFWIDSAGAVKITPGPLTIEHTQPRLIFTDTTASAHDAYLQMDANIFQINVGGNSNLGCGQTWTSLYQEASIAGTGQKLGFFGGSRIVKQTVTGSREGNAALTSLLTVLQNHGLLVNSSTAGNLGFFDTIRCHTFESSAANAEFAFYNSSYLYKGTLIQVTSNDDAGLTAGQDTRYRGALWARADRDVSNYRAGVLMLEAEDGTNVYIWLSTESPKKLRMSTSDPGIDDTAGTVIASF